MLAYSVQVVLASRIFNFFNIRKNTSLSFSSICLLQPPLMPLI